MDTEKIIDLILNDMGERPFARTWETEEKNIRKILKKHLSKDREKVEISRENTESENDELYGKWSRCSCNGDSCFSIYESYKYCPRCGKEVLRID